MHVCSMGYKEENKNQKTKNGYKKINNKTKRQRGIKKKQ